MQTQNLFSAIDECKSCPDIFVIDDTNEKFVKTHLKKSHTDISVTPFIVAHRTEERKRLQSIYDKASGYLDSDFHTRFLKEFDQLAWELSVFELLTASGVTINSRSGTAGPDFDTDIGYVECVCVENGLGDNAIPSMVTSVCKDGKSIPEVEFQPVSVNPVKLRVSSAFSEKQRKYKCYTSQPGFDSKQPRIIALNWWCSGASWGSSGDSRAIHEDPAIQTIFGSGDIKVAIDTKTNEIIDERFSHRPVLTKPNGNTVDVAYFGREVDDDTKRIDGVILSGGWAGSAHPQKPIAINNPFSSVSIDMERLKGAKTFLATIEADGMINIKSTA